MLTRLLNPTVTPIIQAIALSRERSSLFFIIALEPKKSGDEIYRMIEKVPYFRGVETLREIGFFI